MKRLNQLAVPLGIVGIIVMLVVPLPAALLDLLLAFNISVAVLVMLVAMFVSRPLDFAAFPAVILVLTLFRLALNVSATRLVLRDGYAGNVIETFGHFVVGGSLIIGMIVFAILLIIQFVVITNGAGRVAEVGARFTLDAMPGKQMAIDADLNSGLIDEATARQRRADVHAEADFYGAMDGASKFVKGDAIAAVIITLVNLIGGFAIGVIQNGMSMGDAVATYSLLTVGDGLVSQIPALLLSTASGLIVTRGASDDDMGADILKQLTANAMPLRIAGGTSLTLCLIPGLPKIPFILVGGLLLIASTRVPKEELAAPVTEEETLAIATNDSPEALVAEIQVDPLGLELSPDIVGHADTSTGGDLLDRVKALRRKVASDIGILIPPVRTRDNVELPPRTYAIKLFGIEVARGEAPVDHVLAIGDQLDAIPGQPTTEPVFGLEAKWVRTGLRAQAELAGATVVDGTSVITTHLAEVVNRHAARLLGREDVRMLTEVVKRSHPVVIEELTPARLSLGEVQQVLSALLREGVSVRDLVRIFEAVSLRAETTKDTDSLVEAARLGLGPGIAAPYLHDGVLNVLSLDPRLEQRILECLRPGDHGPVVAIDPDTGQHLITELARLSATAENMNLRPVLACAPHIRGPLQRLLAPHVATLPVLSYNELTGCREVQSIGVVPFPSLAEVTA